MISAIQNKLQKHNKVVFFVLLAVIIVAFVFTIGAAPGLGDGQRTEARDFFGYNLASERDQQEMTRLALVSYRILHGDDQPTMDRLNNFRLERIAYLGLADRLRIPSPTDEEFHEYTTTRPAFQNDQGRFDRTRFDFFIDDVEADPRISTGDVALVMDQDFRIERARELLAGPGYVLPSEVRLQLEQQKALWSIELARVDLATFDPEITIEEEALEEFYETNAGRYERAPRVAFSYAVFSPENFLDRVSGISENDLRRYFEQNRQRFTPEPMSFGDEEEPVEQPEVTFEDVREEVEGSLRLQRARRVAGNTASDFVVALFRQQVRPGDPEFGTILENHRGELREAPPASPNRFPQELGFSRNVQERLFRLSEDRIYSDPLEWRNNYIVLLYEDTLPAYVPPLEEIRENVERDFENQERRRLLAERGQELRDGIRSRMAEGESFIEAAEAQELEAESVEPFTFTPPFPPQVPQQLLGRLSDLKKGEVSQMISANDSGYFIYLKNREVPEIDRTGDEFVQTRERMQTMSTMSGQFATIMEFIERETNLGTER